MLASVGLPGLYHGKIFPLFYGAQNAPRERYVVRM